MATNPGFGARACGRASRLTAALAATVVASVASADTDVAGVTMTGTIEFGGRTTWLQGDSSQFENYRDLRDGAIGSFDLLFENPERSWFLRGTGWNVGYDNQAYSLDVGRYGLFELSSFYDQIPIVFSNNARSLYREVQQGVLVLPAGVQATIAGAGGGAARSAAVQAALANARPVDLEYRWLRTGADGVLHVTPEIELFTSYQLIDKEGHRALPQQFGSPGGTFTTLAAPVDEQIHEVRAGGRWSREKVAFSLEYVGSIFLQEVDSITADNPLVAADVVGDARRGRTSVAPDNQAHQIILTGSGVLPIGFDNRLNGSIAYQRRLQDDGFLPQTINPAVVALSPSASSLDGKVNAVLGNLAWTGRPVDGLTLKARYRIYDFDNSTDAVLVPEHVVNDEDLSTTPFQSVHSDYRKQNASFFAVVDLPARITPHVGFEYEHWDRSRDREVADLDEYGPVVKVDWRVTERVQLQTDYAYKRREGSSYGTLNPAIAQLGAVEAANEAPILQSPLLRKYTQADRNYHDLDVQGRFLPCETLDVGVSGGLTLSDYFDSRLGLSESKAWNVGGDAGWRPHARVGVTAWYQYDREVWDQDQRWRPRSFINPPTFNIVDSPLNDWMSETEDQYHTAGVRIDVALIEGLLDGEVGYIVHHGRSKTSSSGPAAAVTAPPPTTGGDGGAAVDWPEITNTLHALTTSLSLHLTDAVTLRGQYRFEDFNLDDFTIPSSTFLPGSNNNSADVWLGEAIRDYQAHVFAVTASIEF